MEVTKSSVALVNRNVSSSVQRAVDGSEDRQGTDAEQHDAGREPPREGRFAGRGVEAGFHRGRGLLAGGNACCPCRLLRRGSGRARNERRSCDDVLPAFALAALHEPVEPPFEVDRGADDSADGEARDEQDGVGAVRHVLDDGVDAQARCGQAHRHVAATFWCFSLSPRRTVPPMRLPARMARVLAMVPIIASPPFRHLRHAGACRSIPRDARRSGR